MKPRTRAIALPVAVAIALSSLWHPSLASQPERLDSVASSIAMDEDRNRIFDNLDRDMGGYEGDAAWDVLVQFKTAPTERRIAELQAELGDFEVTSNRETPESEGRAWPDLRAFAARMTKTQIAGLSGHDDVVQVEPDLNLRLFLDTARLAAGVDGARIDFRRPELGESALTGDMGNGETTYTKDDIVICLLDTGVDTRHPHLPPAKVLKWKDFSPENEPEPLDQDGHGTFTSGIAAGTGSDDPSLRGVAPGAALLVARIGLDQDDFEAAVPNPLDPPPPDEVPSGKRMIDAINWCRDNRVAYGIEIISLSAGMGVDPAILCYDGTDLLSEAANAAVADGIVFIAAAGNDGPRACSVHQPAVASEVVAVGMTGDPRNAGACSQLPFDAFEASLGWYLNLRSSRGQGAQVKPDIVAPGVCIRGPWKFDLDHPTEIPYRTATGTSASAPFVAGVVALILDRNPSLIDTSNQRVDVAEVKRILYDAAQPWGPDNDPSPSVRKSYDYGFGILRAWHAIKEACGAACSGPQAPGQPDHHFVTGALDALHPQQTWQLQDVGTDWPIAVTMVRPDTTPISDKFLVTLIDPSGVAVASSVGLNRHEQLTHESGVAGTYTIKVTSVSGLGMYWLDVSAKAARPPALAAACRAVQETTDEPCPA